MKGHIEITDKVNFVPDGFEKPIITGNWRNISFADKEAWDKAMYKYEASRKTVEVSNVNVITANIICMRIGEITEQFKSGQPCEAEVTDTALITKLS